jgi:hypothetical protein
METDNYRKGKLSPGNFGYVCRMIDILYKNKCMKTLTKTSFFIGIALLGITSLQAQTADDIVQKYMDAVGGKTALAGIKSMIIESNMEVAGNDAPSTTTILVGKGWRSETDFNGMKIIQCVTTSGGWVQNPPMGIATPTAMTADQAKVYQLNLQLNPLVNYAAAGYKLELTGHDSADYKLHMTGNGSDAIYYINMKSYLLDKVVSTQSANGQTAETTISFSDYRKTDAGMMFPFSQTLDLPQISLTLTHKKVTVNSTIDPAVFDMPKQ